MAGKIDLVVLVEAGWSAIGGPGLRIARWEVEGELIAFLISLNSLVRPALVAFLQSLSFSAGTDVAPVWTSAQSADVLNPFQGKVLIRANAESQKAMAKRMNIPRCRSGISNRNTAGEKKRAR